MNTNLSKVVAIIISMVLSLFVICCGGSDSDSSENKEVVNQEGTSGSISQESGLLNTFLKNGTYSTECIDLGDAGLKIQMELNNNKTNTIQYVYTDTSCTSLYMITKNEYDLKNINDINGNKKLNFLLIKTSLKISEGLVSVFNSSEFYRYNDWDAENFKDVTNRDNPYDEDELYHTGDSEDITINILNNTSFKLINDDEEEDFLDNIIFSYQE